MVVETSTPRKTLTEVVNMFDTIHIDTSFFFPSYHVEEETDSSFVNVLKTVSQASPQLINTYVNDLQERESFVMINPKVKTVGSVLNELHYKKNQLQGAIAWISSRPRQLERMNLLKKYRHSYSRIISELEQRIIPHDDELKALFELSIKLKEIPFSEYEHAKQIKDQCKSLKQPLLRQNLNADEAIFSAALREIIFNDKKSAFITRDSDLSRMMIKSYALFFNGRYPVPFLEKLKKGNFVGYFTEGTLLHEFSDNQILGARFDNDKAIEFAPLIDNLVKAYNARNN